MNFFEELEQATAAARGELLSSPVIVDCLEGTVRMETYREFLVQAYHHVRHTVPLLMGCGSRLPPRLAWLQPSIVEYINEEQGHEEWISNDIEATQADATALLAAGPNLATELMVSYAYDTIQRGNPVGFFGMVYVLEGTSVKLASRAAETIATALDLPSSAFTYLRSHGSLDEEHIRSYQRIVNRFEDPEDRHAVVHCSNAFFRLYAGIFASLPRATTQGANIRRAVA